ncbi:glutamine amidotransferase [Brenneria roseae subsp. americana]|uniref:Glutamine amidotransferase n=1 Tax=Brenneria roseae subsp. americana TaxID=1508507 RepID=A0A2U1U2D2_9GAMM|nr:glutamine amidotransferase [Brenneria roseae]PWC15808.1 glutamine amidotransferase [Brenneria roseae subsp. americana]
MKTAVALRHVHFEDLGILAPFLQQRGYSCRYLDSAVDDLSSVDLADCDLLVVLGGPIGAFDHDTYPFLVAELNLIRQRLDSRKPVLGICLGAQLMARALGKRVAPMGVKEIGFSPLTLTSAGERSVLSALDGVAVLHWHGDQFDVPDQAQLLAGTSVCPHQAFAIGNYALGLQFHPEVAPGNLASWLVGHACELGQAGIDPRLLREQAERYCAVLADATYRMMDDWLMQCEQAQ